MQIIIDKRERELIKSCTEYLEKQSFETRQRISVNTEDLPIGDVIIKDNRRTYIVVERKAFADLLASIKDGRYEEQSHRLLNTSGVPPHSILYILEGLFSQVLDKDKKLIYSCMTSLYMFKGFCVTKTSSVNETGELIVNYAEKIARSLEKGRVIYFERNIIPVQNYENSENPSDEVNVVTTEAVVGDDTYPQEQPNYCNFVKKVKKENVTPENIGEIMLSQIPGISSVTAIAIMKKFSTIKNLIGELQNNPDCLNGITSENSGKARKISKSSIESIRQYLLGIHGTKVPL